MKPIIFGTDSVRASMEGRMTMTRRVINLNGFEGRPIGEPGNPNNPLGLFYPCGIKRPRYQPDDILWVREKWRTVDYEYCDGKWSASIEYADGIRGNRVFWYDNSDVGIPDDCIYGKTGWRSPVYMPREAARLFLRVTGVRVERLQEITDEDAKLEGSNFKDGRNVGFEEKMRRGAIDRFHEAWDRTNGKRDGGVYAWDKNPWVWAISFERIEKPEGAEI